jgi:hypothetical protein
VIGEDREAASMMATVRQAPARRGIIEKLLMVSMSSHPGSVVEPCVTTGPASEPLNAAFVIYLAEGLVATFGTDDSTVYDPAPPRLDVPVDAPLLCGVTSRPDVEVVSAPNNLAVVLESQFKDAFKKGQRAPCAVG